MEEPGVDKDAKLDAQMDSLVKDVNIVDENFKDKEEYLVTDENETECVDESESSDSSLDSVMKPEDDIDEIKTNPETLMSQMEYSVTDADTKATKCEEFELVDETFDNFYITSNVTEDTEDILINNNGSNVVIDFDEKLFDSEVESIDCDMCFVAGKVVSPTSYCYVCQIYLCGSCYKLHTKIPATSDHAVVHRNDLIKNSYKEATTYHGEKATDVSPARSAPMNRKLVDPGRYTTEHARDEDTLCAPCRSEGRQEPGSAFCVTCTQYLCVKCKSYHTKFEASSEHEVVHKHSMEANEFKTFVPAFTQPKSTKATSSPFSSTLSMKTSRHQTTIPPVRL